MSEYPKLINPVDLGLIERLMRLFESQLRRTRIEPGDHLALPHGLSVRNADFGNISGRRETKHALGHGPQLPVADDLFIEIPRPQHDRIDDIPFGHVFGLGRFRIFPFLLFVVPAPPKDHRHAKRQKIKFHYQLRFKIFTVNFPVRYFPTILSNSADMFVLLI